MPVTTREVVLGQDTVHRILGALRRERFAVAQIVASTPEDMGRIRAAATEERDAIQRDMDALKSALSIRATVPETAGGEG